MKVAVDSLITALMDPRLYLSGDEDGGVSLHCREHHDGGRPLTYYDRGGSTSIDPAVVNVSTLPALWAEAASHLKDHHREA